MSRSEGQGQGQGPGAPTAEDTQSDTSGRPSQAQPGSGVRPSVAPAGRQSEAAALRPSVAPAAPAAPDVRPSVAPAGRQSEAAALRPSVAPAAPAAPDVRPSVAPAGRQSEAAALRPSVAPAAPAAPDTRPSVAPAAPEVPDARPSVAPAAPAAPDTRPSVAPAGRQSEAPVVRPSVAPAGRQSEAPVVRPSVAPAGRQSQVPAIRPSVGPVVRPSMAPAGRFSAAPAGRPSAAPASRPSAAPAARPSAAPVQRVSQRTSQSSTGGHRLSVADVVPPASVGSGRALSFAPRASGYGYPPRGVSERRSLRQSAARVFYLPTPAPAPAAWRSPTPSEELRAAAIAEGRTPRPSRRERDSIRMAKCHIARCLPARCIFAFMAHLGFAIIYGLRVNMSVAIVAMVVHQDDDMPYSNCTPMDGHADDPESAPGAKYKWDGTVRGVVLSSYFYGYMVAQLPGAVLADMFSAKWVMWCAVLLNAAGCAVMPLAAAVHWSLFVVMRVVQGIGGGMSFPSMHIMISNWAPPSSRSVFTGVIYAGTAVGMVLSTLTTGYLAVALSWEWMFYISAVMCVPWLLCWMFWIEDSPATAFYITAQERAQILAQIAPEVEQDPDKREVLQFPCRHVMRSRAFWAILVAHLGGNCGLYCLITQVPTFIKTVLQQGLQMNTTYSSIPYITMFLVSVTAGPAIDHLRNNNHISTTAARKTGASIALLIPALSLVGISFIGECDVIRGVLCFSLALGSMGAQNVAWLGNHIDIAPNYAGLLMAMTNTLASVAGIAVPQMMSMLTAEDNSLMRWSIGFYAIAAIMIFAFIFYLFCADGNVQYWNSPWDIAARPPKASRQSRLSRGASRWW